MKMKNFLNFYVPADDTLFRIVEMPEDIYEVLEKTAGLMPGMEFLLDSFGGKGVYVATREICTEDFVFFAWPVIEPVDAEERNLFRMAMTNYAEYNKWLAVAVTPAWAN